MLPHALSKNPSIKMYRWNELFSLPKQVIAPSLLVFVWEYETCSLYIQGNLQGMVNLYLMMFIKYALPAYRIYIEYMFIYVLPVSQ